MTKRANPKPIYTYDYISEDFDITVSDYKRLIFAAKVASASDHKQRMGAVLVNSGRVISHSCNVHSDGPLSLPSRRSIHAEIATLKKTKAKSTQGGTLYTARLDSSGRFAQARPCVYCLHIARTAGVQRFVFPIAPSVFDSFRTNMVSDYTLPSPYVLKELSWN